MSASEVWNPVSEATITEEEATVLSNLLMVVVKEGGVTATAVGFTDEQRTATQIVYSVAILDDFNTIVGSVFEHPLRQVFVTFDNPTALATEEPEAPVAAEEDSAREERLAAEIQAYIDSLLETK